MSTNLVYYLLFKLIIFFNGIFQSYFGVYLDDRMVIPLAYSNIKFPKFKYPEYEVYTIRELDDVSYKEFDSPFLLLEKDGLLGVATSRGDIIIEPCATEFKLFEDIIRSHLVIENEEDRYLLRHCAAIHYISLCRGGLFNLIYHNSIVCDFIIDDFEYINFVGLSHQVYDFIKVKCNSKEALIFNGKFISDFFYKVNVYCSNFGVKEHQEDNEFVIVATDNNGYSCLMNSSSEVIIEFDRHTIIPFQNFVKIDSVLINIDKIPIFDSSNYILVDEVHNHHNEQILCYYREDKLGEYYLINSNGELHIVNVNEDSEDIEFRLSDESYSFDKDNLCFKQITYEDDYDYDYDDYDDFDYDRERYYALGGDDYDEWKNKGGDFDDMMDELGF